MIKIYKSVKSTSEVKKILISKGTEENNYDWVEITIDSFSRVFTAKKIILEIVGDDWEEYNDYTFPSSLLNNFLNS
jgi:hypothetical protein